MNSVALVSKLFRLAIVVIVHNVQSCAHYSDHKCGALPLSLFRVYCAKKSELSCEFRVTNTLLGLLGGEDVPHCVLEKVLVHVIYKATYY